MNHVKSVCPRAACGVASSPIIGGLDAAVPTRKFYSPVLKRWLLYVAARVVLGLGASVGALLGAFVAGAALSRRCRRWRCSPTTSPRSRCGSSRPKATCSGEFGEERRAVVRIAGSARTSMKTGDPGRRGRALLPARRRRLRRRRARGARQLRLRRRQQGAGTITMQVARNFFLTREKTLTRKLNEVLLAFKIEASLSKDEILELYVNQIFLGQRAYGFAAASQIYFGKPLEGRHARRGRDARRPAQGALALQPGRQPEARARCASSTCCGACTSSACIDRRGVQRSAECASWSCVRACARRSPSTPSTSPRWRGRRCSSATARTPTRAASRVYTTHPHAPTRKPHTPRCAAACIDYDRRHGYRGPEGYVEPARRPAERTRRSRRRSRTRPTATTCVAAVVIEATPEARCKADAGAAARRSRSTGDGLKFAARALGDKATAEPAHPPRRDHPRAEGRQGPLAASPSCRRSRRRSSRSTRATARSCALVGGFDFNRNKFNHVTQALRQPGSSFKPFIYSAALEKGFTPATVVNDAPFFVLGGARPAAKPWEPKNYDGKFDGPMRLRTALAKSKNLVSVRVLQAIGPQYAQDYITRFGFDPKLHPAVPHDGARRGRRRRRCRWRSAYAVFANGGYRVTPYLIAQHRRQPRQRAVRGASPQTAGDDAERVIDPRNAFIMTTHHARRRRATARRARAMRSAARTSPARPARPTTSSTPGSAASTPTLVGVAWIGFDQPQTLGRNETGGVAALPIWMGYMAARAQGRARAAARRRRRASSRCDINPRDRAARRRRARISRVLLRRSPCRAERRATRSRRRRDAGRPAQEVRNQFF